MTLPDPEMVRRLDRDRRQTDAAREIATDTLAGMLLGAALEIADALEHRDELAAALRETDKMLWEWSASASPSREPNWRPLSVRERRRLNQELLSHG